MPTPSPRSVPRVLEEDGHVETRSIVNRPGVRVLRVLTDVGYVHDRAGQSRAADHLRPVQRGRVLLLEVETHAGRGGHGVKQAILEEPKPSVVSVAQPCIRL